MTKLPDTTKRMTRTTSRDNADVFVLELDDLGVTIRPHRSRDPEAVVRLAWAQVYRHGLWCRVSRSEPKPRRRASRGLLSAERRSAR